MTNNSYQEPILEDYDCPFLEDSKWKEEEQCDSVLKVKTMNGLGQRKLVSSDSIGLVWLGLKEDAIRRV